MKKSLLVTLADKNYIEQAKQLFSSVYWNAGWKGDYMLLAYELPEKQLKWFRRKGILIKKCNPSLDKMSERWPSVILSKLYLFAPEFKKWKNVVFLDADIIVRASLDELTEIRGFAAAKSHAKILNICHRPLFIRLKKRNISKLNEVKRRYNTNAEAFNAGVLVFNTDVIKKDTLNRLKKLAEHYIEICPAIDELSLSIVFYKKWTELPQVYNIYPDFLKEHYNIKAKRVKGIILHFVLNKPWDKKSPFYNEWLNNFKKAEQIDLKNPKKPIKKWTNQEIEDYLKYLKKRRKIFFYKRFVWEIRQAIDRSVGLAGIFLRNNFPKLYWKLRNQDTKIASTY